MVGLLVGLLLDAPGVVGKPLQRGLEGYLEGYYVARRGAYRVVYRMLPEEQIVRVVTIEHRSDVYRQH